MKTTPKPNATKNNKGEEFGLFLSPPPLPLPSELPGVPLARVLVDEGPEDVVDAGFDPGVVVDVPDAAAAVDVKMVPTVLETACLASICTPPTI